MFECLALCDVSRFMRRVCVENEFYGVLGDMENSHQQHFRQVYSWYPAGRCAFGTVVKIACHFSQNISVHNMRLTESSEHCIIHEITVRSIVKLLISEEMQVGLHKKPSSSFLIFRIFIFS